MFALRNAAPVRGFTAVPHNNKLPFLYSSYFHTENMPAQSPMRSGIPSTAPASWWMVAHALTGWNTALAGQILCFVLSDGALRSRFYAPFFQILFYALFCCPAPCEGPLPVFPPFFLLGSL
eukprot:3866232-Pyramimonas_sp.AAC.1